MAVTDYKFAGTAANVDRDVKNSWINPDNAKTADATYTSNAPDKDTYGDWLRLTNFGFTSGDIPDGATINGIEFVINRYCNTATSMNDSALYLYDDGAVGSNLASATKWPTTAEDATYGGATNMCGTTLAQTDIVASTFGVQLSVTKSNAGTAYVDYIKIRVYYTAGGGASLPLKNVFGRPFSGVFR